MNLLEEKIKQAAQKYYTDGTSNISDEEFDNLVDELRKEDPSSEILTTGWGYDINADNTPGQKFKHKYGTAGSLEKCRSWNELSKDIKHSYVCCSLKLDGLSVVLYYENNIIVKALTRGNGEIGIDITDKILKIFPSKLNNIQDKFTGAIRGEILMSYKKFNEYKEIHPEMKNPRNTTAGIINSKTGEGVEYLNVVVYTIVGSETCKFDSYEDMHFRLVEWFGCDNVVPYAPSAKLQENTFLNDMNDLHDSWYGTYPADGIVITKNDIDTLDSYEVVYTAEAFKFRSEIKESTVTSVEWNMSKTGYAVPKIHIKPIELAGTTVRCCTGYNAKYILDNNIGPGTRVTVEKRGEIIPNIQEVVESTLPMMISICPDCKSELVWNGVSLQCINRECKNASIQDVLIWLDKLVPIDNLGDSLRMKFLDDLDLDEITVESIMKFSHVLDENTKSAQWNNFAVMFNKLHNNSTKYSLVSALSALNIPRIGALTSMKLALFPEDVKYLMNHSSEYDETSNSFWEKLSKEIGPANAQSCRNNLIKFGRLRFIESNIEWDVNNNVEIKGKVAITGKLSVKRSDFERELKEHGYSVGDISKDTKFLITDDPTSSSSKNIKADKLGIKKVTELEFRQLYM